VPVFAYKGLDATGKAISGSRDAESARALRQVLRRDGIFLSEAREATRGAQGSGLRREVDLVRLLRRGVRPAQVSIATRQLATLLRAGIPLAGALGALVEQTEDVELHGILETVRTRVNEGGALCDALAAHPRAFPDLYVNMVRAGEASGTLDQILARLADFLDAQIRLRSKVQSALWYPAIMVVLGIGILSLLMVVVVPQITQIFADLERALPWNTQLLIFVSHLTGTYWWAMALLLGLGVWGFRRWLATDRGRARWDRWVLRMPVVGNMVRLLAVARFARTLATMLRSGVDLLRALDIVKHMLGNTVLTRVVEEARDAIREGESIATPLKKSGHFPPVMVHMIAVGERTGQLEEMLDNVALAYDAEVEQKIARLTTMLEPVMILAMGLIVGFIIFSILMPILQMNEFVT
jgi:general secretion pathway protein F